MKIYRFLFVLSLIFTTSFPALAVQKPLSKWDNLIDISYKFTWYPQKDLQQLLKKKSEEYGQSFKEYQSMLVAELTDRQKIDHNLVYSEGLINSDIFVKNKPWKLYFRLAISQFCTFLATNEKIYLQNAKSVISLIIEKKELVKVSFWNYLIHAYSYLMNEDRDYFITSVYDLWNNSIIKSELSSVVVRSYINRNNTEDDVAYFYENIAHLIITKAIIEKQLADLSSLSFIVESLNDKLTIENGYKHFVEAIVARFQGLKSDNYNLNFAVAFVEATANQYEFEEEKSAHLIISKYNAVRASYEFALSLASTRKGKAAILTQYMGFNNYLIRRLIDKDSILSKNSVFRGTVKEGQDLAEKSMVLYDELAEPSVRQNGFLREGFYERSNYLRAMHELWDSSAKLLITVSMYYKMNHEDLEKTNRDIAEGPLLKYFTFFDRYARANTEIVPDNAFFLAAYAASQMSYLYQDWARYITSIDTNNYAFTYQAQAVALFPLDVVGILRLAHQAEEEGRHSMYLQYVLPLASRLRDSKVSRSWSGKPSISYRDNIDMITNVIPNIVDNAFLFIKVLQQTQNSGSQTEDDLYNKIIMMSKVHTILEERNLVEKAPDILVSIAEHYDPEDTSLLKESLKDALTPDLQEKVISILKRGEEYHISRLKNELYASPDLEMHFFLRELYFENHDKIQSPFRLSHPIYF